VFFDAVEDDDDDMNDTQEFHETVETLAASMEIGHDRELLNTFNQFNIIMEGAFPHLFPLGYPYGSSPPTDEQTKHMLLQASNKFAANYSFAMLLFSVKMRKQTSQGVIYKWRNSTVAFEEIARLVQSDDLLPRLQYAIDNPRSRAAKELEQQILPLITTTEKHVPFSQSASRNAYSVLTNMQRTMGVKLSFFFTHNPHLNRHVLTYALCDPVKANYGDQPDHREIVERMTPLERVTKLDAHPHATSISFMLLENAMMEGIIRHSISDGTVDYRKDPLPPHYRVRGAMGHINHYFAALETSKAGALHTHYYLATPISWTLVNSHINNRAFNLQLSKFTDSIITSHLDNLSWDAAQDLDASRFMALKTELTPSPLINPVEYASVVMEHALKDQNHSAHNMSCFPPPNKPDRTCRFGMPTLSWNQESSFLQIALPKPVDEDSDSDSSGTDADEEEGRGTDHPVKPPIIYNRIAPPERIDEDHDELFLYDKRIIVFQPYRGPMEPSETPKRLLQEYDHHEIDLIRPPPNDPPSASSFLSPFSKIVSTLTASHNNLQLLLYCASFLGAYLAKYMTKAAHSEGVGFLKEISVALKDVLKFPSQADDKHNNPARTAIHLVERVLNNRIKNSEYPLTLILVLLLGFKQFRTSHDPTYINMKLVYQTLELDDFPCKLSHAPEDQGNEPVDIALEPDSGNDPSIVPIHLGTDYKYRSAELESLSLLEFACITNKKKMDDKATGRGNLTFRFKPQHPQYQTHHIMLASKQFFPLLSGMKVPRYPEKPPPAAQSGSAMPSYNRARDQFGKYMLLLLNAWVECPEELNYQG
jgi:hypothetical protein